MIFKQFIYKCTSFIFFNIKLIFNMIHFWLKIFLLTIVLQDKNCNKIKPSDIGRIINGRRVHVSEAPFIVQLLKNRHSNQIFCHGFLVGPDKVVTAAHCIYNVDSGK